MTLTPAYGRDYKSKGEAPVGYTACECRDCMETAIGGGLCWACDEAGCEPDSECKAEPESEA